MQTNKILSDALGLAILRVFIKIGELPARLSEDLALERYGEKNLSRWIKEKLISKDPETGDFDLVRLEALFAGERQLRQTTL